MAYSPDDYKTDRDGELLQLEAQIDAALQYEAKNRRDRLGRVTIYADSKISTKDLDEIVQRYKDAGWDNVTRVGHRLEFISEKLMP